MMYLVRSIASSPLLRSGLSVKPDETLVSPFFVWLLLMYRIYRTGKLLGLLLFISFVYLFSWWEIR